jgi:peptidoglycan/LPS O-acetylase OafA/YrhL
MAKVTLVFAVLLIALGLAGFFGTGHTHYTALIPAWIGLALGIGGLLAINPDERRRKPFMHINVTIGLVGFVGTFAEILRSCASAKPLDMTALIAKLALVLLLLIYVFLCVRSFLVARRSGKV